MKVTVEGEYAAKSKIVARRQLETYKETVDVGEIDPADVLYHARIKVAEVLKEKDPMFNFIRTCSIAKESIKDFPPEAPPVIGHNPAKDFDKLTGKPFAAPAGGEPEAPTGSPAELPKPKRGGKPK